MTMGDAVRSCLQKYLTWEGRAPRSEYWYFQLFGVLLELVGFVLAAVGFSIADTLGIALYGLVILALCGLILPTITVTVRRLHDTNRSGWWYWIALIPFGGIVLLVFMCLEGTQGANNFGPDPLSPSSSIFS